MNREIIIKNVDGVDIEGYLCPRGGGFIAKTATVDDSSYIGKGSLVLDNSLVTNNSHVTNSLVTNNSRVNNSLVTNNSCVNNSLVTNNSRVNNSLVTNSRVDNSNIPDGLNGLIFSFGGKSTATVNGDRLAIGCNIKTIKEWLSVTYADAQRLGSTTPEIFEAYHKFFVWIDSLVNIKG